MPFPISELGKIFKKKKLRKKIDPEKVASSQGKVFGIGLSRTGTTSLAEALRILGYETVDWNYNGKIIGWPEFYAFDAATDTPCSMQFETLYHSFDNSKFIYTKRNKSDWSVSIKKHFETEEPSGVLESMRGDRWKSNEDWGWENTLQRIRIHSCLYAKYSTWIEAYDAHDKRVRSFFENKPPKRFSEINIPSGEGWRELCNFLDRPVPNQSFPHENKS